MAQVNLGRVVGYSAYEIAVQNGFIGTEAEWLASLKGETGPEGPAGTYTAGTGIDITNNVISATGGGGSGLDEDDIKNIYGMSIDNTMEDDQQEAGYNLIWEATTPVSFGELTDSYVSINAGNYEELVYQQLPYVNGIISELVCDDTTIIDEPTEVRFNFLGGGGPSDAIEAAYTYAVGNYTVFMMIVLNADLGETKMTNIHAWGAESGSIAMKLFHPNFTSLATGVLPHQVAYVSQLYNDDKVKTVIADVYGMAPGTEEWRVWEEEAVIDDGRVDVSIDHDPINYNDILLFENEEQLGYFQYDGSGFVYYDTATALESTDFSLSYNSENETLHLTGADGTYTLSQNYTEQIAPTPLNDAYAPQGVIDDIGDIYSRLDDIISVPTTSGASEGDVLTLDRGGDPVWATPTSEVPSYDTTTIGKVLGVQQQDLRSPGIVAELAWVDKPEGVPDYDRAAEGDVLTINDRGDMEWTAPSAPSEIEYESMHSSGEDYVVTKISGDNSVEVREMLYDNGDYNDGNSAYVSAGELGASDGDGASYININPMEISFNALDGNDDPVSGSLSMSADGELEWNGSSIFPACPTTTDGHYMLCATVSLGEVVYEWEPVATASGVSF